MVVGWHSGYSYTVLGQAGVDLFFVISGFVMMLVSSRENSPARFGVARFLRVVPFYWLVTFIAACVAGASMEALVSSLLFWPDRPFPVVVQGWSLDLEIFYYVLFALTLFAPRRIRLPILAAEIAILCLLTPLVFSGDVTLRVFANPMASEFLAGACLFELWRRNQLPLRAAAWLLGGVSIVCLGATHLLGGPPEGWTRVAIWGVPCLAIVAAGLGIEQSKQLPRFALLKSGWGRIILDISHAHPRNAAGWDHPAFTMGAGRIDPGHHLGMRRRLDRASFNRAPAASAVVLCDKAPMAAPTIQGCLELLRQIYL